MLYKYGKHKHDFFWTFNFNFYFSVVFYFIFYFGGVFKKSILFIIFMFVGYKMICNQFKPAHLVADLSSHIQCTLVE